MNQKRPGFFWKNRYPLAQKSSLVFSETLAHPSFAPMSWSFKKIVIRTFATAASLVVLLAVTVFFLAKIRPDLFEQPHDHKHCMPQLGLALKQYSLDHDDKFPYSPTGYGDALLLLTEPYQKYPYLSVGNGDLFTGHGYDGKVFVEAYRNKTHVPEEKCGRVYVQGLTEKVDINVAFLFDKLPSAHVREVFFNGGQREWIKESEWKDFAEKQIELLMKNGVSRETATSYYRETLK